MKILIFISVTGIFAGSSDKAILIPAKRYSTRYLTFAVLKKKSYYDQFVTDC
jgi:hypothetical protein